MQGALSGKFEIRISKFEIDRSVSLFQQPVHVNLFSSQNLVEQRVVRYGGDLDRRNTKNRKDAGQHSSGLRTEAFRGRAITVHAGDYRPQAQNLSI
jgi:hypothetical protein